MSVGPPDPVASLTCFVIGPIGSALAPHGSPARTTYEQSLAVMEEVIKPACAEVGLTPVRADGLARAGEITEQIFRRLRDDDVVIADLTGANGNVMYELGLRHTRDKLTVQIGEYGQLLFDVNTIRTIQFSPSPLGLINARKDLVAVLSAGLVGDYDPVTATRIWSEATGASVATGASDEEADDEEPDESGGESGPRAPDGPESDDSGPAVMDVLAEGEERAEQLLPAIEAVNRHIVDLGELAESTTEAMGRSDAAGGGMRGRLRVATRYAAKLDSIASLLEDDVAAYAGVLEAVSAATLTLIDALERDPSLLDNTETLEFGVVTRQLAATTRGSMQALNGMVEAIRETARMSRVLKDPSARLTSALDRFARTTSIIDEWDRRLQSLGVPLVPEAEPSADAESQESGEAPEAGLPDES